MLGQAGIATRVPGMICLPYGTGQWLVLQVHSAGIQHDAAEHAAAPAADSQPSPATPAPASQPQGRAAAVLPEKGHPSHQHWDPAAAPGQGHEPAEASEASAPPVLETPAALGGPALPSPAARIRAYWPEDGAVSAPVVSELDEVAASRMEPAEEEFEPVRKQASRNSRRAQKRAVTRRQPVDAPDAAADSEDGCIVCWAAAAGVMFQPCGHFICCASCASPFLAQGMPCPMCRAPVAAGVYLS